MNRSKIFKFFKNSFFPALFVVPLLFSSTESQASHMMGADITYKCIDTLRFEVTVTYYRDCRGVPLNSGDLAASCDGLAQTIIPLTRQSIKEITPVCSKQANRCNPQNTRAGNGIEEHVYTAILDFNPGGNLALLAHCATMIRLTTTISARNNAITTGPFGNLFTYAEIDISQAPCNSSPQLTSEPVAVLCCNQPFFFNNGASDVIDFDSLSYEWSPPLTGWNTPANYSGANYSFDHPFAAFYPGNLAPPFFNTNSNPPIGIFLDPETGDIIFTPTDCSEVTVAVIKIREWRKDANGVMQNIGVTHRDMQFITQTCPDNNPPEVLGPYSYEVCEGSQLCFDVETDDEPFIVPPPAPPLVPDSVTNTWNRGIPGATYTVTNPTALNQTGRFCWTPGVGTARTLPYTFTVTARDNACPLNAVAVRGFTIKVKPRAEAERDVDTLDCGLYAFEAKPSDGFQGTASYQWTILDSNRNIVTDRKVAAFHSTGSFLSNSQFDSIQFKSGGFYIIQLDLNNAPINCPSTYFDTLIVPPLLQVDLSIGEDTFLCAGTTLNFQPIITNAVPPISFQWSTMGVEDDGTFLNNIVTNAEDTLDNFTITIDGTQYDTAVSVIISDQNGCTAEDNVQVFLRENPVVTLPPDQIICENDSFILVPELELAFWVDRETGITHLQGDTLEKEWSFLGNNGILSIADSITVRNPGYYILSVKDSLNCQNTDTFLLEINDPVTALAGPDQTVCDGDMYTINASGADTADKSKTHTYTWFNITPVGLPVRIDSDSFDRIGVQDSTYRLLLSTEQKGVTCTDDDTLLVTVNELPLIQLGTDESVCCNQGLLQLNFKINTPTGMPATGGWSSTEFPNLISNNLFNIDDACGFIQPGFDSRTFYATYTYLEPTTQCKNSDSFEIVVNHPPSLLLDTNFYCQNIESFSLDADIVISPFNTSLGTPRWECIQCNGNDFNQMLENRGNAFVPDYWLNIDPANYTLKNPSRDTVILRFTYTNQHGCRNVDSTEFYIWSVPKVEFTNNRELCIDEGIIGLDSLTGVNLTGGTWSCYDTLGFETCNLLGGLTGDSINTTSSVNDNASHTWLMRYSHDLTGCLAWDYIPITINPRPTTNITPLIDNVFCENSPAITLDATPNGGDWTNPEDPTSIVNNRMYNPQSAQVLEQFTTIFYNFISPTTGCSNIDSITVRTDRAPIIEPISDTTFCRDQGQTSIDLTYNLKASHSNNINWITNNPRALAGPYSATEDEVLTLNLQNQKADTFRVIIFAEALSLKCNSVEDFFDVIVNPIPDVTIINSNPGDCNPVDTELDLAINNDVDLTTSQFNWQLGDAGSATTQSTTATYTSDGSNLITVTVTSEFGCDTTLNTNVDVYPIPDANFVPSPNNFTTSALPRFVFIDSSKVSNILDSKIETYEWDYGDLNDDRDTSTDQKGFWLYPVDTGSYNVTLKVTTNHGCTDTAIRTVIVGPDITVFIPNAFTPDGAGPEENEGFKPIISGEKSMELIIFNRWGEVVFTTTQNGEEWDGYYNGQPVQQDVYAYSLKVVALNDKEFSYSGTITLLK